VKHLKWILECVRQPKRRRLTSALGGRHTVCMKRTNLVLDERLLDGRRPRLPAGQKTYSRTVGTRAGGLRETDAGTAILSLRGSGAWHGDLPAMRDSVALAARARRGNAPA